MNKPKGCRIAKLKGFSNINIIVGRDFSNVLKEGHVYEVRQDIEGVIMLRDLGEHSTMYQYSGSSWRTIIEDGTYILTKSEGIEMGYHYEKQEGGEG